MCAHKNKHAKILSIECRSYTIIVCWGFVQNGRMPKKKKKKIVCCTTILNKNLVPVPHDIGMENILSKLSKQAVRASALHFPTFLSPSVSLVSAGEQLAFDNTGTCVLRQLCFTSSTPPAGQISGRFPNLYCCDASLLDAFFSGTGKGCVPWSHNLSRRLSAWQEQPVLTQGQPRDVLYRSWT